VRASEQYFVFEFGFNLNHGCSGMGTAFQHLFFSTVPRFNRHDLGFLTKDKAGSTIGQTGQMPGGLALEYQKTRLLVFQVFRLSTTRQYC